MKLSLGVLTGVIAYAIGASCAAGQEFPSEETVGELYNLCKTSGVPNTYVAVLYDDGTNATYSLEQCYPFELNGVEPESGVFCKNALCHYYSNLDCTGDALPTERLFIDGEVLFNSTQYEDTIGAQASRCQAFPNLPGGF